MSNIIQELEAEQMTKKIPEFAPGDTVVVQVKVKEGERERLQAFEGVVIGKRNRGLNSSFTVRKISNGEGVERVFQTFSPTVAEVEDGADSGGVPGVVRHLVLRRLSQLRAVYIAGDILVT